MIVAIGLLVAQVAAPHELYVPAWSAYAHPRPEGAARDRAARVVDFADELVFYVHCVRTGELTLELEFAPSDVPVGERDAAAPALTATFAHQHGREATPVTFVRSTPAKLTSAALTVAEPGYHRIGLERTVGVPLPAPLVGLRLRGDAAEGARASTVERRNAASVHLAYPRPKDDGGQERGDVEWFHCRVTPRSEPLWTYYMATGWHRGYFGLQVNSETERRVIFSVWDSGDEGVDRAKVAPEDLVQLVARGADVHASGFGNEGTGGHSHLVFPWRLGDSFDFLVQAVPEGTATTYTGWFRVAPVQRPGAVGAANETTGTPGSAWRLIASFRAPKDGRHLGGLYSFNENFSGANGDRRRVCEFGEQWVRTQDGAWHELVDARFTHDGHGAADDKGHSGRLDRSGGVRGARFYLAHGGFVEDTTPGAVTQYGGALRRAPGGSAPPLTDAELAGLPRE